MHALEKIIVYYNQCKDNDIYKAVIENIFKNLDNVKSANIYQLAELCFVSPTTISRLSKKMGYENFTDFRMSLVNCMKNYPEYNHFIPISSRGTFEEDCKTYLRQLRRLTDEFEENLDLEKVKEINAMIHASKKVRFYTCGLDSVERHFQELLIVSGKESAVKSLPTLQLEDVKTLNEESLVLYIAPVTVESGDIGEVLEKVKEKGARIVLLTDSRNFVYSKFADERWWFEGAMGILDDQCFAMMLTVLAMDYRDTYMLNK